MKNYFLIKIFLFISIPVILSSCSCSSSAPIRDLSIPKVTSTTPSSSSENAVINTYVNVTFSEKMNGSSINKSTFQLFDSAGNLVSSEVANSGASATLKPDESLDKLSEYSVFLSRQIKDLAGNQIIANYRWQFITGIERDETFPEVEEVFPTPDALEVLLNTNIVISLTKAVSSSSVTADSFVVSDIEGNRVDGTLIVDGSKITFDPDLDLNFDTKYDVTLSTSIEDLTGNGLRDIYVTRFTTIKSIDEDPPLVNSVSPENGTENVSLNSSIIVTFSETMGAATINSSFLTLEAESQQNTIVTLSSSGANVMLQPASLLAPNREYTVTIKPGMEDLAGNQLETKFTWRFTTGTNEDSVGPTVTNIIPENDASNVASNNAITVTFSEVINPTNLSASISLTGSRGSVETKISYSGNTAIIRPMNILENSMIYTVSLLSDIVDLSGNPMLENYSWQFTTGITPDREIPSVTSVYPKDLAQNVAINTAVVTRFSEAMDPFSINANSFFVSNSAGDSILGSLKTVGASVTFRPLEPLSFSTVYTVTINKQATDLGTNALNETYNWRFTTSSENDIIRPTILSTVPASSANFAPVNRGIIVIFSETMDLNTINSASFYLADNSGTNIPGSINYAGDTITFLPNSDLEFAQIYTATIMADVADMANNTLGFVHSWSFKTSSRTDLTPPQITSTIPLEGNPTIVSFPVTINFDKDMDPVSFNTANLVLRNSNGEIQTGTVSTTNTSAIFLPRDVLEFDSQYTMTVTTGVRDIGKIHLESAYSWLFVTSKEPSAAPPFVITASPFSGQEKVRLTTTLNIEFSEPINCDTLTNASFTLLQNETPVSGAIECDAPNRTATFTPDNALGTDSMYLANLTSAIQDFDTIPKNLTPAFSWPFSTAPWTQQFGTITADSGQAIAIDNEDNVVTAGNSGGSLAAINQGGANDIFVSKHSQHSLLLWSKQFGTSDTDSVLDITTDAENNIYLVGYSDGNFSGVSNGGSDIIILKLNSAGSLVWQKQMGAEQNDVATSVQLDNNGDLIVAGFSDTDFDGQTSSGQKDMVVIKLAAIDGAQIWSKQLGTINVDIVNDIAIDSDDNIYLAGYFYLTDENLADITLTKLDTDSNTQWRREIGTSSGDRAQSIAIDSLDNIYISGFASGALDSNTYFGGTDQVVLKYDTNGTLLMSEQIGTAADDQSNGIAVDSNDDVILAGYTAGDMVGTNAGDTDLTLIKMDADGAPIWMRQFGTEGSDLAFDVTQDSADNVYITGRTEGSLDSNVSLGSDDAIIVKWNTLGVKQ